MAKLIDGKRISQEIKDELKAEVAALAQQGKTASLAVVQVGADPASSVYVRNKKNACAYIGGNHGRRTAGFNPGTESEGRSTWNSGAAAASSSY